MIDLRQAESVVKTIFLMSVSAIIIRKFVGVCFSGTAVPFQLFVETIDVH